jgi:hypothetical protein
MAPVRRRVGALLAVVGAAALLAQPVWASASADGGGSGSGTFAETSFVGTPSVTTTADGTTVFSQSTLGTYSGTISGTFTEVISGVVFPDGTQSFSGIDVCACSVAGRSGSFVDRFSGSGVAPNFVGILTVIRGSGNESNLHVTARFKGAVAATGLASGRYTIRYRFHSGS